MKKKILAIDDDALVLRSLQMLFKNQGYEVQCAKNGQEAIAYLSANIFHLIISDIRMPGQDGLSLIKMLKRVCEEKKYGDIPFIFITGYASEDSPIEALKMGAKDYILKPFDLDELIKSAKQHLA